MFFGRLKEEWVYKLSLTLTSEQCKTILDVPEQ